MIQGKTGYYFRTGCKHEKPGLSDDKNGLITCCPAALWNGGAIGEFSAPTT